MFGYFLLILILIVVYEDLNKTKFEFPNAKNTVNKKIWKKKKGC